MGRERGKAMASGIVFQSSNTRKSGGRGGICAKLGCNEGQRPLGVTRSIPSNEAAEGLG